MKKVHLFHNPGAGNEEHDKKHLLKIIESADFECGYSSTKQKGWGIEGKSEIIIVAGGDGTVRKVVKKLLKQPGTETLIGIIPLGTANNISKTLEISGTPEEIINGWSTCSVKEFDVGSIKNIKEEDFFLEGMGFGIFPFLMSEMQKVDEADIDTVDKALKKALELLYKIVLSYEPHNAKLRVDDTDHSGKFLLVEILNTRSIGPNLLLSSLSDPGDGEFEVVMIPEDHKEKFAAYIFDKLNGKEEVYSFHTLKAKNVRIEWEGKHVHVDDRIVKIKNGNAVKIEMQKGLLNFLVPEKKKQETQTETT